MLRARGKTLLLVCMATILAFGQWVAMAPASAFEGSVSLGGFPTCVAVVDGHAYVTSSTSALSIVRISDGTVDDTLDTGANSAGLAVAHGKVFVASVGSNRITVIDTATKAITAVIDNSGTTPVGGPLVPWVGATPFYEPIDIAVGTVSGRQYLFVANIYGLVTVVDALTNLVVSTVTVPGQKWGIVVDGDYAYVPIRDGNAVAVVDITRAVNNTPGAVLPSIAIPAGSDVVNGAVADGVLYINDYGNNRVLLIDLSLAITDPSAAYDDSLTVGQNPFYASIFNGKVYVSNQGGDSISVIDPITRLVVSTITDVNLDQPGCTAGDQGILYVASGQNGLLLGIPQAPAPTPPAPPPPTPSAPGAPLGLSAIAGDAMASVSWTAPADPGSYPVTDYSVTASPGGGTCLVDAPARTCDIRGLANGTSYTFKAKALNGAGWGPYSDPSNAVTPRGPAQGSIVITGSRGVVKGSPGVIVTGTSTELGAGAILRPWVRFPSQTSYAEGSARVLVDASGAFTWQRRTGKVVYVYMQTEDASLRSNRVIIRQG